MQRRLRHILILLVLAILFLPMSQKMFSWIQEKPLVGIPNTATAPKISLRTWLDGTFQDSLLNATRQNIGFHNTLVRLNNQWFFTLFHTAQANSVIIGQQNCLYDKAHIDSYLGKDFIGDAAARSKMRDLERLRTLLGRKGIQLMLVIVPGKGMCLPEFLPLGTPAPEKMTNYRFFDRLADSLGLPYLDLAAWYGGKKQNSRHPLYALGGNHWSEYCATLAADTLLGFMEGRLNQDFNRFSISSVHNHVPPSPIDDDINLGMNLLFPIRTADMAYPEIAWQNKPRRTRVLSIGDSFYFKFFTDFSGHVFEQSHFWFYFRELHVSGAARTFQNAEIDLRKEIEHQDVIMLYMADPHLTDLGFGFVEAALKAYTDPEWRNQQTARIEADIQKDAGWMAQIIEKAIKEGISTDSMLHRDAIWVLENSRLPD